MHIHLQAPPIGGHLLNMYLVVPVAHTAFFNLPKADILQSEHWFQLLPTYINTAFLSSHMWTPLQREHSVVVPAIYQHCISRHSVMVPATHKFDIQLKGCVREARKWLFRPNCFSSSKWAQFQHVAFHFIEKHTPYLSLLVSLSFSTNNICKNAVFFLAVSFPKKAFVFPNNRISEARICRQCWLKKISQKRKREEQKKLRDNVFLLSPRSHAKIELIWTRKKIRPK